MPGEDIETRRRRAAYRAGHRGTKEMDWLLGRYAAAVLPEASSELLGQLERLLVLPDPELHQWIVSPRLAEGSEFADLIADLRRFHALE
jgi:antitoxin CptB